LASQVRLDFFEQQILERSGEDEMVLERMREDDKQDGAVEKTRWASLDFDVVSRARI
jgi:hypothetical protein